MPSSSSSSSSSSDSDVSSRGSSRRSRVRSGRDREPARQIPREEMDQIGEAGVIPDPIPGEEGREDSPNPEIPQDPQIPLERIERDEEERIQNPRPAKRRREEESKRSTSFKCPSLDDALYQRLKQVKGSSASKNTIDQNERALYSVQQKILEAAQPLFFLSNEKLKDNDHREAISDALQLLGDSFHEVTQQRRRNVLKQTSPSYLYLLDDQDNFNSDEASSLFGRSFIRSMVRSSQQQAELSNLQPIHRLSGQPFRTGGQQFRHLEVHTNRPLGQSHRHRFESIDTQQGMSADNRQTGDSSVPPARFGGERDLFENNTAQHPNAGSSRSFSNRGRYVSNLKSDSSKPVPTTEKEILVGARISSGAERWAEISSDPWILGVVTSGLRLEFSSYPIQDITPLIRYWERANGTFAIKR
ncbi:hypothetical protein OUZ56_004210 [Daphnia magna]|uniref:Uncharacterized protein n=1 Tax=Daphnia magna TaxID=35525 RepID=A0ABQ9YP99_9CRUS|nr:hypothetical protein OUZ56_004210 [Daphnia magna]